MYKVWFENPVLPAYEDYLDKDITVLGPGAGNPESPFQEIKDAQAIIAGGLYYDADMFKQAPKLLVVSRTGIGYDKVDVNAASAAGIAVVNAPEGPTISTAECAITLMMSVARNIKQIENELRHELSHGAKRRFYDGYVGIELYGKTLGLVGLGRIGSHVARIASAIGMRVLAYDPFISAESAKEKGIAVADTLEALLNESDVVSLHLPLIDENRKFMNAGRFAQMKQGAIFINTARGGHVDEQALIDALDSGKLFGAGLDVTDPEPPLADNPLLAKENVVLTPHIASGTADGKFRIYDMALKQVLMVLNGERPPNLLNPEAWDTVYSRWKTQQNT